MTLPPKIPAALSWSGGKDSAFALHKILEAGEYDVRYLVSGFDEDAARLSVHDVREELIAAQAKSIGIPLLKFYLRGKSNDSYEKSMEASLTTLKAEGIQHIIFGDINLQDLREYREAHLATFGMTCVFPLWGTDTTELVIDFIESGFRSKICCIMEPLLTKDWLGRVIDKDFVKELPATADAGGENGEYHSFCFDGPIFSQPIKFTRGRDSQDIVEQILLNKDQVPVTSKKVYWKTDFVLLPSKAEPVQKTCSQCGSSFECNATDIKNCHCYGVKLNRPLAKTDDNVLLDCLCANCLQKQTD